MELLPVERDSIHGQALMAYFAVIAAWAGEKDLALQQLATAAPTYGAAIPTSYGMLKLFPFWDPLPRRSALRANRRLLRAKGCRGASQVRLDTEESLPALLLPWIDCG
jgi:hypothetical protein